MIYIYTTVLTLSNNCIINKNDRTIISEKKKIKIDSLTQFSHNFISSSKINRLPTAS